MQHFAGFEGDQIRFHPANNRWEGERRSSYGRWNLLTISKWFIISRNYHLPPKSSGALDRCNILVPLSFPFPSSCPAGCVEEVLAPLAQRVASNHNIPRI